MAARQDRLLPAKAGLAIASIFIICILLGYDQHPSYYYDDETIAVNVIRFMEDHSSLDTNWNNADWDGTWTPFMFDYDQYNFSSWITSQYYLKQFTDIFYSTKPLLLYRCFTLGFHLLTLALILYAGWRWMGGIGSILSGAFFATSPMFMIDTHYTRPETFLTLIVTLAIFVHIEQEKSTTKKPWLDIVAGFIWGAGIACKISVIPMALLFFIRRTWMSRTTSVIYSWFSGGLLAILIFAPYLFINYNYIMSGAKALFSQYMAPDSGNIRPAILSKYLMVFVNLASLATIIYSCRSQEKTLRITSQFLILISIFYLVFFSLATFINESNLSHMAGAWSWMFAMGFIAIAHHMEKFQYQKILMAALLMTTLLPSLVISTIIYVHIFNKPGVVQQSIRGHEKLLLQEYGASLIIPVESASTDMLENARLPDNMLIRVSLTDCYNFKETIRWLDTRPLLKKIDELELPLHFLPCSNKIDTIHFPPGYAYYASINAGSAADTVK